MPLTPEYGETPVDDDEAQALTPEILEQLGQSVSKADIFAIEQAIEAEVTANTVVKIIEGDLGLSDLLADFFIRDLHRQLYGDIWTWAGKYRQRELNIGIAPESIAAELRTSLQNMLYRFEHTADWDARQFGIAVHAETVRIHPFTDGNGRTTRLLANLIFLAAQDGEQLQEYDWDMDKDAYISLLRAYDQDRDPRRLADFVRIKPFGV